MKANQSLPESIDEYIAGFPESVQHVLEQIRAVIKAAAPDAQEAIKYRLPTFVLNGNLVHFGAFNKHIGFYPTPSGIEEFKDELSVYENAKGSVQFPLDKPTLAPVLIPGPNRFPHVARGGSWADDPARLRSAARRGSNKNWIKRDPQRPQSIWWLTDAEFVGFRIVRPVEEQDNLKGIRSTTTRESK